MPLVCEAFTAGASRCLQGVRIEGILNLVADPITAVPEVARPPHTDVFGVRVHQLTIPSALEVVRRGVTQRTKVRMVFCTVHTLTECQRDPRLMDAVNGSVVAPDGMPIVWLGRRRAQAAVSRVYGPDMLLATVGDGLSSGYRHFFFGSTPETLALLVDRLRSRHPGLVVAGTLAPPFRSLSQQESDDIVDAINQAKPDVVWVGLGMPKQELWIAEFQERLDAPVLMAVGAAFDFHAGTVRQAPMWMQRSGVEWLFRLVQEPRRLWRRYLVANTRFLGLLARQAIRRSKRSQLPEAT